MKRKPRRKPEPKPKMFKFHLFHHADQQQLCLLERIHHSLENLMSAVSEYAAKQAQFNQRQGAAVDSAVESLAALGEDVKNLNDKITELQNSQGEVTPEDQALINELETAGGAATEKMEALSLALKNLDELTPPKPPTA